LIDIEKSLASPMTEHIHSHFEDMGEVLVRALSRNWSGGLRADAQLWLAAKDREAHDGGAPPPADRVSSAAMATERRGVGNARKRAVIAPAIAAVSLIANIMMVAYLMH
jgi:hypothetical protein